MFKSEQLINENECDYSNLKPIEVFKYPTLAAKIILDVNSSNISQSSSQINDLIKNNRITIQMALYLIDKFSKVRPKEIESFSKLYQNILIEFSCITKPKNEKLAAMLHNKRFKLENYNLYSTNSPLFYIAFDKVDDLKSKFPKFNVYRKIDEITPLDWAIKYGSELCFNYLKNMGALYTNNSEEYAVQGGNKNIFMQMIEDGKSFDKMINIALEYHNNEIAEYLKSNCGQTFDSIAESMYFGNYDVASYLLSHSANVNKIYEITCEESHDKIAECPLSIAIKWNSTEIVKFLIEHGADVNMKLIFYLLSANAI